MGRFCSVLLPPTKLMESSISTRSNYKKAVFYLAVISGFAVFIYIILGVLGAYLILPLDIALRAWGPWRWLHYWATRYNQQQNSQSTFDISASIRKIKAFLRQYRRRRE